MNLKYLLLNFYLKELYKQNGGRLTNKKQKISDKIKIIKNKLKEEDIIKDSYKNILGMLDDYFLKKTLKEFQEMSSEKITSIFPKMTIENIKKKDNILNRLNIIEFNPEFTDVYHSNHFLKLPFSFQFYKEFWEIELNKIDNNIRNIKNNEEVDIIKNKIRKIEELEIEKDIENIKNMSKNINSYWKKELDFELDISMFENNFEKSKVELLPVINKNNSSFNLPKTLKVKSISSGQNNIDELFVIPNYDIAKKYFHMKIINKWEKYLNKEKEKLTNKYNLLEKQQNNLSIFRLVGGVKKYTIGLSKNETNKLKIENKIIIVLNKYKNKIKGLLKSIKEFNQDFLDMYQHQLYIVNYLNLILYRNNFKVYKYISLGITDFYKNIVDDILEKIEYGEIEEIENEKTIKLEPIDNNLISFANKKLFINYDEIPKKIILNNQIKNWIISNNNIIDVFINDANNIEITTENNIEEPFDLYHKSYYSDVIFYFRKNHYITLKLMKSFLTKLSEKWTRDEGNIFQGSLLNKYNWKLKTEDIENSIIKNNFFIFNTIKDLLDAYYSMELSKVGAYLRINDWEENDKEKVFTKKNNRYLNITSLENCERTRYLASNVSNIKFNSIYDSKEFPSNESLGSYMGLPRFLNNNKSIMLLTSGYSGVGKTYSLFGNYKLDSTTGEATGGYGILQRTINNILDREEIYFRSYEIYGLASPYKFYWDRTPDKYCHYIYNYKDISNILKNEPVLNPIKIPASGFDDFIKNYTPNEIFEEISFEDVTKFSIIVNKIDEIRKKTGRIKETDNNPESSRSIMIHEFLIKLCSTKKDLCEKFVKFVVVDLPGQENLIKTYVDSEKSFYQPKDIIDTFSENIINPRALKAMMFSNPLWLVTIPEIADKFYIFIEKYHPNILQKLEVVSYNSITRKISGKTTRDDINGFIKKLTFSGRDKQSNNYSNHQKIVRCVEIFRHLIQNNYFNIIREFYDSELLKDTTQPKTAFTGFEAVYINENILGLLTTIINKIKPEHSKIVEIQKEIYKTMMQQKDVRVIYPSGESTLYKDELQSQTYFFRDLTKNVLIGDDKRYYNDSSKENIFNNGYEKKLDNYKNTNLSLKHLVENMYDYNKIFKYKDPPIKTILEPYFDEETGLDNFYLFFVVSNNSEKICGEQIELLNLSKNFINLL